MKLVADLLLRNSDVVEGERRLALVEELIAGWNCRQDLQPILSMPQGEGHMNLKAETDVSEFIAVLDRLVPKP